MKFNFKLSNIEVMDIKIGGIEIDTEMSMAEVIGCRKESEHMLEQLPLYLEQLAIGVRKFMSIENEFSEDTDLDSYLVNRGQAIANSINEIAKAQQAKQDETYEELFDRKVRERKEYFAELDKIIKANKENNPNNL